MSVVTLSKDAVAGQAQAALGRINGSQMAKQFIALAVLALAVAAGLWLFFWTQTPPQAVVFGGMDPKTSAEAAEMLRAEGVPYELDPVTGTLTVPQERLHEARLKLAAAGLPDNGGPGMALIERDPGFGVSQFVENARYQHALETELARTMMQLRPVREARVHLAIPKPSAFTRQREPAAASVVLQLHPGRDLDKNQVSAIVHLVASSIPNLAPERVTVVDEAGRLLSADDADGEFAETDQQFERTRRQEKALSDRIARLLEPITGPGRVRSQVAVEMDFAVVEEAREVYGPDSAQVRSEQISESSRLDDGPQGVPGAASNTPPTEPGAAPAADAAAQTAAAPSESTRNATRNFELDRTLSHVRQPSGRIERITAAVLVDHVPRPNAEGTVELAALSDAELARIEALVKEAIGFDATRGDSVSVMNAAFVRPEMEAIEPAPIWENPALREILRIVVGAIAVLAVLFFVLRPAIRTVLQPRPTLPREVVLHDPNAPLGLEPARAPEMPMALGSDHYEERVRQARQAVGNDPKRVAQVVKDWVAADA